MSRRYDDVRDRDDYSRTGSRYDDRYVEQEIEFRRSAPPVRERERDEIDIREDRSRVARDPPAFLRDDYGRSSAGPVVLRAREREDFDFVSRPRRRSPSLSPEPDRRSERESITIRRERDDTESRPPPRRERSPERESILIRRERDETESRAPPRRDRSPERERETIVISREKEEAEKRPPPRRERSPERDRETIVIRRDRDDAESRAPPRRERSVEREEIIIRRDGRERSRPAPPPPPPPPPPPEEVQREEIIIRREGRSQSQGPGHAERESEKITIQRYEDDDRSFRYAKAPPRDWDRDDKYREVQTPPPPSRRDDYAATRPKSRERARHDGSDSEREIVLRREETKDRGRGEVREREELIIRDRSRSASRSLSPAPSARSSRSTRPYMPEPQVVYAPQIHQEVITHHRHIDHGYELAIATRPRPASRPPSPPSPPSPPTPEPAPSPAPVRESSAERIEIRRSGERNGQAYDEDIVIDRNEGARSAPPAPFDPPARRERYEDEESVYYSQRGDIGRRYGRSRDPKAGLWTEITKDLVVKEAIIEMGYEYEETDEFYYVIAYLGYDDVARLVGLSEDIRKDRRRRVREIEWEGRRRPEPEPPRRPLAIEPPRPARPPRGGWEREDDRYIEREMIYRGGRPGPPPPPPPPPPGWRRY